MEIFINNFSIICSLGSNKSEVAKNLFSQKKLNNTEDYILLDGTKTPVMKVTADLPPIPQELKKFNSRNNQLILHNLLDLKKELDALIKKYGKNRIGVIFGTSTSGINEGINALQTRNGENLSDDYFFEIQEMGNPSSFISKYLGLESISYTISTACTSSSRTFIEAKTILECDICDAVIVGGSDVINDLTLNGFHSLESVSPNLTNPFSANRDGINIGEGSTVFILSKEKSDFQILGLGESSDAYHISSPDPTGKGAISAMVMALESGNLKPDQIHYLNLHGTGTVKNDQMEALAVSTVFKNNVPVSSTKPFTGHALGAAGGIELAFCLLSIDQTLNPEGIVPQHIFDDELEPGFPPLNFQTKNERLNPKICMSNNYAFGGNNVSIIIGRQ